MLLKVSFYIFLSFYGADALRVQNAATEKRRIANRYLYCEPKKPIEQFLESVQRSAADRDLLKLFLTDNKMIGNADDATLFDLKSVSGKLVDIKAGFKLQLNYRYISNDKVKNYDIEEIESVIGELLSNSAFRSGSLSTSSGDYELKLKRGQGKYRFASKAIEYDTNEAAADLVAINVKTRKNLDMFRHDREKRVPISSCEPFLRALGVTSESGRPLSGMSDKLKQIQKFVEIISSILSRSHLKSDQQRGEGKRRIRIVDMGCGLGYLTFASHLYLAKTFSVQI